MLFRKRRRPGGLFGNETGPSSPAESPAESYYIDSDMMLKGVKVNRHGKPIRQHALMINGCIKLVTSGDYVDKTTYEALIAAGAIVDPRTPHVEEPMADAS